jgi:hypothetical protein
VFLISTFEVQRKEKRYIDKLVNNPNIQTNLIIEQNEKTKQMVEQREG